MLLGRNRQAGFIPFIETECYQYCPGLRNQGEGLLRFSELPSIQIPDVAQAWALLLKTLTIAENNTEKFLKKWKLSNRLIRSIQQLLYGLDIRLNRYWQLSDVYSLGMNTTLAVENMLLFFNKDSKVEETIRLYELLPITDRSQLNVTGNDLLKVINVAPGKWVGDVIEEIEEAVINGQLYNEKQTLLLYASNRMAKE